MTDKLSPHVAILMATYNGSRFIQQQLDSIIHQRYTNWSLWISDDGSNDGTRDLITEFARQVPGNKISMVKGPGLGATRNFMALLNNPKIVADFVSLADQDDFWLPDHISRAVANAPRDTLHPFLFCGPTIYVDENSNQIGRSAPIIQEPSFANALVQSIAGGNTMVLNKAAHDLFRKTSSTVDIDLHDWWIYQIVSGAGGAVVFDEVATVHYRQHSKNEIGSNSSLSAKAVRQWSMLGNKLSEINATNIDALSNNQNLLDQNSRSLLAGFSELRSLSGFASLRALKKLGLYRQTRNGMFSLRLAAFLGKL